MSTILWMRKRRCDMCCLFGLVDYRHQLKGKEFKGCRECHIEPDWLLVYRVIDDELILELLYTGTHSDLF